MHGIGYVPVGLSDTLSDTRWYAVFAWLRNFAKNSSSVFLFFCGSCDGRNQEVTSLFFSPHRASWRILRAAIIYNTAVKRCDQQETSSHDIMQHRRVSQRIPQWGPRAKFVWFCGKQPSIIVAKKKGIQNPERGKTARTTSHPPLLLVQAEHKNARTDCKDALLLVGYDTRTRMLSLLILIKKKTNSNPLPS